MPAFVHVQHDDRRRANVTTRLYVRPPDVLHTLPAAGGATIAAAISGSDQAVLLEFVKSIGGTTPRFRSEGDDFRDAVRTQGVCQYVPRAPESLLLDCLISSQVSVGKESPPPETRQTRYRPGADEGGRVALVYP
jgi:hypothetical protein